jgi:hypothetical protein
MTRKRIPIKYKGGAKQWEADVTLTTQNAHEALVLIARSDSPATHFRPRALFENHLKLGLLSHWHGEKAAALEQFSQAAACALAYVEENLPRLTGRLVSSYDLVANEGAIAAALSSQEELAHRLFVYAERFSSGLVTGLEEKPADPDSVLGPMPTSPMVRAYTLIRLGRLSGFKGLIFPEGAREPVWTWTDVHGVLDTAQACFVRGRFYRDVNRVYEKGLLPLLRALLAALEGTGSEEAASQSLLDYEGMIRDMSDFRSIYPVVLDLRVAFPNLFEPSE